MAVFTDEFTGLDLLLQADTNVIGGKDDVTLTLSRDSSELPPNSATGSKYGRVLVGLRDATLDFSSLWIANSAALNGFAPTVEVGSGSETLEGITEITITIERDQVEFANNTHTGWRARKPTVLRLTANISLDYFDPESTNGAGYKLLQTAFGTTAGTEDVNIELPGGSTAFDGTWAVEELPIGGPSPTTPGRRPTATTPRRRRSSARRRRTCR